MAECGTVKLTLKTYKGNPDYHALVFSCYDERDLSGMIEKQLTSVASILGVGLQAKDTTLVFYDELLPGTREIRIAGYYHCWSSREERFERFWFLDYKNKEPFSEGYDSVCPSFLDSAGIVPEVDKCFWVEARQ